MATEFKNTLAFIRKYGTQVENEIRTRLVNQGKVSSGKLFDSIRSEVREAKNDFLLSFKTLGYGKFVDKGVRGAEGGKGKSSPYSFKQPFSNKTAPPIRAILAWTSIQGIPEKFAWGIRRNIWKFGIAPTNFFTIPTKRRQKQLEAGIQKYMGIDLEQNILADFKKESKK